jgi:hypothetical protein
MKKMILALVILIVSIWTAIGIYWMGIEKGEPKTEQEIETITLSGVTVPVATNSSNIESSPSSLIKVTTKNSVESSSASVLLTSPTITVKY